MLDRAHLPCSSGKRSVGSSRPYLDLNNKSMKFIRSLALVSPSKLKTMAAAAAMVALAGPAPAALVLQSNGVEVLDTNTSLLWLYDWNSAGLKNWAAANSWVAGLTVGGATAGAWRLPGVVEFLDLYAEAGNSAFALASNFSGLASDFYWTGSEFSPGVPSWLFGPGLGLQFNTNVNVAARVVAVRQAADVVAHVPAPQTLVLTLLALGAAVMARRMQPR